MLLGIGESILVDTMLPAHKRLCRTPSLAVVKVNLSAVLMCACYFVVMSRGAGQGPSALNVGQTIVGLAPMRSPRARPTQRNSAPQSWFSSYPSLVDPAETPDDVSLTQPAIMAPLISYHMLMRRHKP